MTMEGQNTMKSEMANASGMQSGTKNLVDTPKTHVSPPFLVTLVVKKQPLDLSAGCLCINSFVPIPLYSYPSDSPASIHVAG